MVAWTVLVVVGNMKHLLSLLLSRGLVVVAWTVSWKRGAATPPMARAAVPSAYQETGLAFPNVHQAWNGALTWETRVGLVLRTVIAEENLHETAEPPLHETHAGQGCLGRALVVDARDSQRLVTASVVFSCPDVQAR